MDLDEELLSTLGFGDQFNSSLLAPFISFVADKKKQKHAAYYLLHKAKFREYSRRHREKHREELKTRYRKKRDQKRAAVNAELKQGKFNSLNYVIRVRAMQQVGLLKLGIQNGYESADHRNRR